MRVFSGLWAVNRREVLWVLSDRRTRHGTLHGSTNQGKTPVAMRGLLPGAPHNKQGPQQSRDFTHAGGNVEVIIAGRGDSSGEDELTCVVADDDRFIALGLSDTLARHGIRPIGIAHTAGDAIARATELKPSVLLVDLDFGPGPTGLDVAARVRRILPHIGVVVMTGYEDPRLLAPNLPSTPVGSVYLVKQQVTNPKEVADVVRQSVALSQVADRVPPARRRIDLTDSQVELLRLVAMGMSNVAISEALVVTPAAVEKAVTRLAKRLGVDRSLDVNLRVGLTHRYLDLVGLRRGHHPE